MSTTTLPADVSTTQAQYPRVGLYIDGEWIYDREVALDDTVTVVRFSQIVENPPDFQDRLRGVGGAQN